MRISDYNLYRCLWMRINDLRWVSINGYCLYDSFLDVESVL